MFLRYSQTATIHLYGHGGSSRLGGHARKLARVLKQQLQAASGRIVSFSIIKSDPAILRLWPARTPNLKKLVIGTRTSFPPIFSGEMPLLRSLVTPVTIHHRYLITKNLTNLTLYPPYTLEKLLAILKSTLVLRRLELHRISGLVREDLPRVSLPHLEDLSLSNCYHSIIRLIDFPERARVTVSVPDHLERGVSWRDIDIISSFFIPPAFLQSSTLKITTRGVHRPTEVRIVGQETGDKHQCHVYIDLEKGSNFGHQYSVCTYAAGMVQKMTSVSNLQFYAHALFSVKCTTLLRRFSRLKVLTLSGSFMYPIFLDLVSTDIHVVPSLERVTLDQAFMPIDLRVNDWLVSREQAGCKVMDYLVPAEVDE